MDYKRIEALLDKYWEAETTLEEEQELIRFFTEEEVPTHLSEAAQVFRYFALQKTPKINDPSFDERVIGAENVTAPPHKTKVIRWDLKRALNIAAAVGGVVVASFIIRNQIVVDQASDTFDDPKVAFEETKKALELLSTKLNKGKEEAMKIRTINDAQEKVSQD